MLISTVIVSIGFAVAFGAGSKFGQTRRKAACAINLGQLHMALSVYAAEHNGAFPVLPGAVSSEAPLSELVPRYTTDTAIFIARAASTKIPGQIRAGPLVKGSW